MHIVVWREEPLTRLLWFHHLMPDSSTTALENCMAVSYNSAPWYYSRETKANVHTAESHLEICSIFIHSSHKLETTQMALTTEQIFKTELHSLDVPTP